jgi:hypothetical protein
MKLLGYSFAVLVALNFTACTVSFKDKASGFGGGFGNRQSAIFNSKPQISRLEDSTVLIVNKGSELEKEANDIYEADNSISYASVKNKSKSKKTVSSTIITKETRHEKANTLIQTKLGNKVLNKLKKSNSDGSSGTGSLGVVFLIVGILMILFVSILLGILVSLIGLILSASGNKSRNNDSSKEKEDERKTEYVDVLYLKNGSIIRGLIIEQIPNTSVKIKTADGSVFVHVMEDVIKITKEPK